MTYEAPTPPQYDASRVMLNGAAIALVANLTSGMESRLIAEIQAVERRQSTELDKAVTRLRLDISEQGDDIDGLQAWREDTEDARMVREGQTRHLEILRCAIAHHSSLRAPE
jgi:hypothetical protein